MTDSLAADFRWYMGHLDADAPTRLHDRGVWSDRRDGIGSALGAPKLHAAFELWLSEGERTRRHERVMVTCAHPLLSAEDRAAGVLCDVCGVRDEAGAIVAEAGRVAATHEVYRWPMRATLGRLRHVGTRKGRPNLAATLRAIEVASGSLREAADVLARSRDVMGDPDTARAHFACALNRCRHAYRSSQAGSLSRAPRGSV